MGDGAKTVNYKGEVFTDEMRAYLYGEDTEHGTAHIPGKVSADRAKELFSTWMFGFRPKPVDPSEVISRQSGMSGLHERAAAGSGMSGLFGAGNFEGSLPPLPTLDSLDTGPMAKGVPYSVPPLPKLKGMFAP